MINSSVNRKSARKRFAVDDRIRIDNFLDQEVIDSVAGELVSAPFDLAYVLDGKMQTTSKARMDAMSAQDKQAVNQQIITSAADGVGFLYGSCHMGASRPADIGERMVQLFDFVQGNEMIEFIQTVTGDRSIGEVSGHYTRYVPGHFLTRHRDVVEDRQRRFAYVLSFTPEWHPDWGGLLQYYEEDGTPRDAWAPNYNSLTLFDVRHIHAVTYVTPFAKSPRLSLTGWFKSKPH
jgi:Rps23 Pro-64 3,4-dihydroxylase Tpa1-like proline 4-hydroxylase